MMGGLIAMSLIAAMPFMGGGGSSAAAVRNDPEREKTQRDLERIAAAQRKRERKAARRNAQNTESRDAGRRSL